MHMIHSCLFMSSGYDPPDVGSEPERRSEWHERTRDAGYATRKFFRKQLYQDASDHMYRYEKVLLCVYVRGREREKLTQFMSARSNLRLGYVWWCMIIWMINIIILSMDCVVRCCSVLSIQDMMWILGLKMIMMMMMIVDMEKYRMISNSSSYFSCGFFIPLHHAPWHDQHELDKSSDVCECVLYGFRVSHSWIASSSTSSWGWWWSRIWVTRRRDANVWGSGYISLFCRGGSCWIIMIRISSALFLMMLCESGPWWWWWWWWCLNMFNSFRTPCIVIPIIMNMSLGIYIYCSSFCLQWAVISGELCYSRRCHYHYQNEKQKDIMMMMEPDSFSPSHSDVLWYQKIFEPVIILVGIFM